MLSETLVDIDINVFNKMVSKMKNTRTQLERSLNKSEKILKKLCELEIKSLKYKHNHLKFIDNDKQD